MTAIRTYPKGGPRNNPADRFRAIPKVDACNAKLWYPEQAGAGLDKLDEMYYNYIYNSHQGYQSWQQGGVLQQKIRIIIPEEGALAVGCLPPALQVRQTVVNPRKGKPHR
jgi:hypothetical protein